MQLSQEQPSSSQESVPPLLEAHAAAVNRIISALQQRKSGRHLTPELALWLKDADAAVKMVQEGFSCLRGLRPIDAVVRADAGLLRAALSRLDATQVNERAAAQAALDGVLNCQLRPPQAAAVISTAKGTWGTEMTAGLVGNTFFCKYFDNTQRAFSLAMGIDSLEQDDSRLPRLGGTVAQQLPHQAVAAPAAAGHLPPSKRLRNEFHELWRQLIFPLLKKLGVRGDSFTCA